MIIRIDTAGVEEFYWSSTSLAGELHRLAGASQMLTSGVEALKAGWARYQPGRTPTFDAVDAVAAAGRCVTLVAKQLDKANDLLLRHIGCASELHSNWGLSDLSLGALRRSVQASVMNGLGTFGSGALFGAGRSDRRRQLMVERYREQFGRDTLLPSWLTLDGYFDKGLGFKDLAENAGGPRRFDAIEDAIESTLRRAGHGSGYERLEDLGERSLPWLQRVNAGLNIYGAATDDLPNYLDARARYLNPSATLDQRLMAGADVAFDEFKLVERVPTPYTFAIGRAGSTGMATGEAMYDGFASRADDEIRNAEAEAFGDLHTRLSGTHPVSRYDSLVDEDRLRAERSGL